MRIEKNPLMRRVIMAYAAITIGNPLMQPEQKIEYENSLHQESRLINYLGKNPDVSE